MKITVDIPEEFAEQARSAGMSAEGYIESLIEDHALAAGGGSAPATRDIEAFLREMGAGSKDLPALPDEAFTRAAFYRDCDG